MPQKQEKTTLQEQTWRYSILSLVTTKVQISLIPLNIIEIVLEFVPFLQVLRYSIDYFTINWLGQTTSIFSYLDVSFYLTWASASMQQLALVLGLIFMNLYWIVPLSFFLSKREYSNWGMNVQKLVFILARNLLFVPLVNMTISLFSPPNHPFHVNYPNPTFVLQFVAIVSLSVFTIFLAAQSFFNFEFLNNPKCYTRLKKSAFTSTFLLGFMILNEVTFTFLSSKSALAAYALSSLLMFGLFIIKNQHLNQRHKLVELSFLCVNLLGIGMTGFIVVISYNLSLALFFIMAGFVVATVMKYKTYSLKFQLENINKWPTADIILRYTNNLRYYLSRKDEYLFRVYIHGYMQIHRHKCDHEDCASRIPFTDYEKKLFQDGHIKKEDEQIFRFQNVIKRIYLDGYKLTPINPELQLQNCIYLYERGEKDQALKNLLVIKFQDLSFDKYYKFNTLKSKIHREMSEVQDLKFIDLVSELMIKHEQEQIIAKLDKAAIKNLQFWSILNEDHPDFQKLNEVGAARIRIRQEVRQTYNKICQIAYSEKVTSLYVQYLEAIQNDEAMFNTILESVKKSFNLESKIVLQDWANTSQAIMVISIQENNYGSIIDINSSCALLFGHQKYEIINHNLKVILGELDQSLKSFLGHHNQEDIYAMKHKNGYMLKVKRSSQNYNSMDTGMAYIISLTPIIADYTCSFFIHHDSQRIVGISSSSIALAGIELKTFEYGVLYRQFFKVDGEALSSNLETKTKVWTLSQLVEQSHELQDTSDRQYRLNFSRLANCNSLELKLVRQKNRKSRIIHTMESSFQFQVQANLSSFKYYGCHNHNESFISQFSQLNYAQSLKQSHTIPKFLGEGIKTLRLRDNIIQVIEQIQDEEVAGMKNKNKQEVSQFQNIPRKDEQQIFSNRSAFEHFIYNYSFARSVNFILLVTVIGLVGFYIFFYLTFTNHSDNVNSLAQQIAYRNLIIGAITKQLSFVYTIQQMQNGMSLDSLPRLVQSYNDNLAYLNSIKFNGGTSFNINIELGNGNVTFESNEYLLSFINYAQIISNAITPAKNVSQLLQAIGTSQLVAAMNYLQYNAPITKEVMMANAYLQQGITLQTISDYQRVEIIMLVAGIVFLVLIALTMLFSINKINKERINIFEIFLDITEMQIQQFSSKTQRFLTILHVQDANGEVDVQEEVENTRKINSSTFAKKKRFKHINFNKSIYFRLLIIPLFGVGFFLHSFITNYLNLQFQANSYHYFFLTSQGDYNFYSGMSAIQRAYLTNTSVPSGYRQAYILYYRDYFDLHYETFGYIDDFHQAFTNTFMLDTCNGTSTIYGSTQIPQSCNLPLLYPNGSYLVFTDLAMKTVYLDNSYTSLTSDYIIATEVLSKTHRKMSDFLIQAQTTYTQQTLTNLLTALIVWILVMNIVGFVYGVPIMKKFVDEINEIKNILSILPISLAKELPLATPYFNKIIHDRFCC